MKNAKLFSHVLIITSVCFIAGCTRENISYGDTTREAITRAQWSIDYYFAGQDRTAEFSSYTFNFVGNGTLKADNGTNSFDGNWSLVTDGHRNDVLSINISEALLQNINDQWKVNLSADGLTMKGAASQIHLKKL
jgi:hypothetical protein